MGHERADTSDLKETNKARFEGLCGKGKIHTDRDESTWMAQYLDDLGEWSHAWGFGRDEQSAIDNLWNGLTKFSFEL